MWKCSFSHGGLDDKLRFWVKAIKKRINDKIAEYKKRPFGDVECITIGDIIGPNIHPIPYINKAAHVTPVIPADENESQQYVMLSG